MDTSYIGSEWWKQPDNIYQTLPHSKTIEIKKQEEKKQPMKGSEQSEWNEWGEWQWRRVSCGDNPRVTHGLKGRQPRGTETTWTELEKDDGGGTSFCSNPKVSKPQQDKSDLDPSEAADWLWEEWDHQLLCLCKDSNAPETPVLLWKGRTMSSGLLPTVSLFLGGI